MSAVYKRIQISIRKSTKQHRENFELHVRTFSSSFFEHFWFIVRKGAIRFRLSFSLRGMDRRVSTGTSDDQRVSLSSLPT